MGSQGPLPVTTVHVTGFKKFHGVPHNPTETIVSNLKEFVSRRGLPLPQGICLGSCTVLEAAGHGGLPLLYEIMESPTGGPLPSCPFSASSTSSGRDQVIWVHFGANAGVSKFAIERQAVNEATFLFPDEHRWQPQQFPVVPEDGGISQIRRASNTNNLFMSSCFKTTCSIETIIKHLKTKGFDVVISDDADRFVCNYVYYHSLRFAKQKGHKSLFVHVPLFSRIDEDTQMEFAASLLEALALSL